MANRLAEIRDSKNVLQGLSALLEKLHIEGPVSGEILEEVALFKRFHPKEFATVEPRVISAMGLFYKIEDSDDLYSFIMGTVGEHYRSKFGKPLTPVQASVRHAIETSQFVSISAPTSAGKSYSIRDFIAEQSGDAVVIVPSRALIAEYVASMKLTFAGAKNVMVSPFVDDVFRKRDLRHVFVLTPERARELFVSEAKLNIGVFFFDEAQMSEETGRGVLFDVIVRRARKRFPSAKVIFAHPFVDNPEAQLTKHHISEQSSYARSYTFGTVGKICVQRHTNGKDYIFSPYAPDGHRKDRCVEFGEPFEDFAFNGQHSLLIFVSKASIYNGSFLEPFERHIATFENVTHQHALEIIDVVERTLGADKGDHKSKLVSLLRKGVVIHHGSVPLEVRYLLEEFIRGKHARICFATNTLAQGVNMPFDIVWLHSMRVSGDGVADRALSFKNLTGRAGRLSDRQEFDFGYVFTRNAKLYAERTVERFRLSESSVIDADLKSESQDHVELIDAIRTDSFDDEHNLPRSRVERLDSASVSKACERILDQLYRKGSIRQSVAGDENREVRKIVGDQFRHIFEASINRQLYFGEESVFNTAVSIFLQAIAGRTFREISGIRFSSISRRNEGRQGEAQFSQPAEALPNSKLKHRFSMFADVPAKDVSYDAVVFDTYDYMDKVISFSLVDSFIAAFKLYQSRTRDQRALKMIELLRYGTNNVDHILLMRYGFPPEMVTEIVPYIQFVSESEILFLPEIKSAPPHILKLVDWYLP